MSKLKDKIIGNANELFQRLGYNKTTLSDIASSVGKVKTAIYYYFPGKEEIFANVVRFEASRVLDKLTDAINAKDNPIEKLETYIETRAELMAEITERYKYLRQEWFQLMPIVEKSRTKYHQREVELITTILITAKEEQFFDVEAPELSASMLVNTLRAWEVKMYVTADFDDTGLNTNDIKQFLLYGIIQHKQTK